MESKLIDDLSEEHRSVERLLASLLHITAKGRAGDEVTKLLLARHLHLFRELMDVLHHGREEDILFESMLAAGMPREQGPVAVMLAEHEQGRSHVMAMGQVAAVSGALTASELDTLNRHATAFVQLLSSHIAKEDNILYPMAYRLLGEAGIRRIDDADATLQMQTPGERARLMTEAERLIGEILGDNPSSGAVRNAGG